MAAILICNFFYKNTTITAGYEGKRDTYPSLNQILFNSMTFERFSPFTLMHVFSNSSDSLGTCNRNS